MINARSISMVGLALLGLAAFALPATADWNAGDPYKMHYPQLPDLTNTGIDVLATVQGPWVLPPQQRQWKILADDWLCTETGPVSDIHFWISYRQDQQWPIVAVLASIHGDVPGSPAGPPSHPGILLWSAVFDPNQFVITPPFQGHEGWYDPNVPSFLPDDHLLYWQVNIKDIVNPFPQEANTIYWLDLSAMLAPPPIGSDPNQPVPQQVGWKTSLNHFQDDAVWWNGQQWIDLHDPLNQQSLDMAFVITPEPGALSLVALGGAALLRRRRRR
jgi:hypothetical protein